MQSKTSGPVPFIENHSKVLRNSSKGNLLEAELSFKLHQQGIPILVSAKLLRRYGQGQVDICRYYQAQIQVYEVKFNPELISSIQYRRLMASLNWMIQIFNAPGKLEVINSLPN